MRKKVFGNAIISTVSVHRGEFVVYLLFLYTQRLPRIMVDTRGQSGRLIALLCCFFVGIWRGEV